jgi:hypothetical protein
VFWGGVCEKVTLSIGKQLNLEIEDDDVTNLQDSYVEFLTNGGFIELESENQRISDEEVAEDMPNIPEENFGIRLLAEALNKADDALKLFERQDPNTS